MVRRRRSSSITNTPTGAGSKKGWGDLGQVGHVAAPGVDVAALVDGRPNVLAAALVGHGQGLLGLVLQARGVDVVGVDVGPVLGGDRARPVHELAELGEALVLGQLTEGVQAAPEVQDVAGVPPGRQAGPGLEVIALLVLGRHDLEPVAEEGLDLVLEGLRAHGRREAVQRGFQEPVHAQVDLTLAEDPQDPEGVAPDHEGVTAPGRGVARDPSRDDGVELVGHGQADPGLGLGEVVALVAGEVVLADRDRDLLGLALLAGVDLAHLPLELGELAHDLGREVGPREARREVNVERQGAPLPEGAGHAGAGGLGRELGVLGAPAGRLGDLEGQGRHARDPVQVAPEALHEHDRRQVLDPFLEGRLLIELVEEDRVAEAGVEDALVPVADHGVQGPVRDVGELRLEVTRGLLDGEIPLVPGHGLHDHDRGQGQEALVEAPHVHGGPLDEVDDLAQELGVASQALGPEDGAEPLLDQGPPLARLGDHVVILEEREVGVPVRGSGGRGARGGGSGVR